LPPAVFTIVRIGKASRLTDKDTIVLADFSNNTGDAIFDDTLKTALNISLRQSPFLNVLSDSEVAEDPATDDAPAGTKLTPRCPRALPASGQQGLYCGIDWQSGQRICAGPEGGELPERRHAGRGAGDGASKEKVLDALGAAASKLRGELGESLATVQKFDVPLAQATTSSLEALKALQPWQKAFARKAPPRPCLTINVPSSWIRILPWATRRVGSDYTTLGEVRAGQRVLHQGIPVAGACQRAGKAGDHRRLLRM
jgi:hypothetical protein